MISGWSQEVGAARIGVNLALFAAALSWTWYAGRDLNWDLFNYHLYAGFSVVHDRFDQDFFAAFPAYYNPYAHLPFYALTQSSLSALGIAAILASAHALVLSATFEMGLVIGRQFAPMRRIGFAALAALLALLNPVYLLELGTSFIDISTGVPVVAGWLALVVALAGGQHRWILVAGALMGMATGFKLSNAIFAIATLLAFIWMPGAFRARLQSLALFCLACAACFLLVAGPWAWRLYQEFGNPLFPMFNGVFKSPDFVVGGAALDRFLPRSLADVLLLPWRMMLPETMIHVETASPDIRYAVLFCLVTLVLVVAGQSAMRRRGIVSRPTDSAVFAGSSAPSASVGQAIDARALTALLAVFLASWGLWLLTSGNSRYFIPAGALAGVLLTGLAVHLLPFRRLEWAVRLCLAVVVLQSLQVAIAGTPRFSAANWTDRWIEVSIPQRYRDQPYLYLTVQAQSLSFLAPEMHPASGFFNITGGFAFDPVGPGSARAKALLDRFDGRLRTLISLDLTDEHGRFRVPDLRRVDVLLIPWGFVVDRGDCDSISVAAGLPLLVVRLVSARGQTVAGPILNCGLVRASAEERVALAQASETVRPVFEHLEAACPNLFKPIGLRLEGGDDRWQKSYTATDTRAWVTGGRLYFHSAIRGGDPVDVGRADDWRAAPRVIDCERRAGYAFGIRGN